MPGSMRRGCTEAENLEAEETKLPPGSMAALFEADVRIRNRLRFREEGKLMRWFKNDQGKEVVGACSMPLISLNVRALALLAKYWCPKSKKVAKSPSIQLVRKEVGF